MKKLNTGATKKVSIMAFLLEEKQFFIGIITLVSVVARRIVD